MANLKIISPAKIMVGFIKRDDYYYDHNGEYHKNGKSLIGFATFKEGSILRKEKSWNQWRDKNIAVQELDNIPTPGFKLKSVGQRSRDWFGTGRHVWQIVDPRGFILEITSENMYALMEECDIIKGEIKADCVWAWSGANMSLVPTTSELYETVISNTNRVNTKADKSQLQIGNKVTLKDGTEGIYYGKYHALLRTYSEMTKIDKFLFWAPIPFIGMLYIFYRLLNPIKSPYSWLIHFGMGFVQGWISAMALNIIKLYFHYDTK